MRATEMLFFTKDKQALVPAADPRARFFAFAEGQEIPDGLAVKVVSGVKNKMETPPMRKGSSSESRE